MPDVNGGHTAIIITGGGSGIGFASAHRLLTDWPTVKVVVADLRPGGFDSLIAEFGNQRLLFLELDVTSASSTADVVRQSVEWAGKVTGLVNCAGNSTNHSSLEMTPEQWREVLDCHLDGHFYMNQAVARHLVATGDDESHLYHPQALLDTGSVDIIRLDATCQGGLSRIFRLNEYLVEKNIPIAWHVYDSWHSQVASIIDAPTFSIEFSAPGANVDPLQELVFAHRSETRAQDIYGWKFTMPDLADEVTALAGGAKWIPIS
jgi:hypothetical protein